MTGVYELFSKAEKAVFDNYFQVLLERLELTLPKAKFKKLNLEKLKEYTLKNYKNDQLYLYHNTKDEFIDSTMAQLIHLIKLKKGERPIITAYNTLFYNGNKVTNVPAKFVRFLLNERKVVKKKMFTHINDEDQSMYTYLDLLQTAFKILANSYYGAFGAKSFCLYNPDLGPSITYQGQMIIQTAILGFEGLIGGNYLFDNFSEVLTYIHNIVKKEEYDEELILEVEITDKQIVEQILDHCEFTMKENEIQAIYQSISGLTETLRQKLYFKNNLNKFLDTEGMMDFVAENLVTDFFPDVNEVPESINEDLVSFNEYVKYFVFYHHPWPNKSDKSARMTRTSVLLSDTDSTFLNIHPFVLRVCGHLGWDIKDISKEYRCSTVSIMTYVITSFIQYAFDELTRNANVLPEDRPLVNMKSELNVAQYKLS